MERIRKEFSGFVDDFKRRLNEVGIDLSDLPIDHVCYRVRDQNDYKKLFKKLSAASLFYTTKFFHERSFHLFVLRQPLTHQEVTTPYLEFSQPGGSDRYERGFQHLEFHTNLSIHDLIKRGPKAGSLLFLGKHDGEEYLKWPDKVALKLTRKPVITKALFEDNPEITANF